MTLSLHGIYTSVIVAMFFLEFNHFLTIQLALQLNQPRLSAYKIFTYQRSELNGRRWVTRGGVIFTEVYNGNIGDERFEDNMCY